MNGIVRDEEWKSHDISSSETFQRVRHQVTLVSKRIWKADGSKKKKEKQKHCEELEKLRQIPSLPGAVGHY